MTRLRPSSCGCSTPTTRRPPAASATPPTARGERGDRRATARRAGPRRRRRSSPRAANSAISAPVNVAPTTTSRRLVDDEARGAVGVAAVEASRRRCPTWRRRRRRPSMPRLLRRWPACSPTAATCGSVKITRGSVRRRRAAGAARRLPRMTSAAMRAWCLPMWVSSARPLTSPDDAQPGVAGDAQLLVDLDGAARLEPDGLEPEVVGQRAPARWPRAARRATSARAVLELRRDLAARLRRG